LVFLVLACIVILIDFSCGYGRSCVPAEPQPPPLILARGMLVQKACEKSPGHTPALRAELAEKFERFGIHGHIEHRAIVTAPRIPLRCYQGAILHGYSPFGT
jgi:hypothetical protein